MSDFAGTRQHRRQHRWHGEHANHAAIYAIYAPYGAGRSGCVWAFEVPEEARSRSEALAARLGAEAFRRSSECFASEPVPGAGGQDLGVKNGSAREHFTQPKVALVSAGSLLRQPIVPELRPYPPAPKSRERTQESRVASG
jgi:hypothetical protein